MVWFNRVLRLMVKKEENIIDKITTMPKLYTLFISFYLPIIYFLIYSTSDILYYVSVLMASIDTPIEIVYTCIYMNL